MKKYILFLVVCLVAVGNTSYAGISDKERERFDYHLKRIKERNANYRVRKETQRQKDIQRAKQNRAKAEKRKQLENIAKRNTRLNQERLIRETEEYRRNTRAGGCYTDLVSGLYICI